ncbi:hypothetical protein CQW23_34854 [Capsicum baccatum]|uniref:Uncharacterized protein n=1 Tax=Capsicum baccatum TaxID=33114 RepID=A0A2G2UY09_CAPBA|nr:hypothetical protein CQW23_34854 [Capsicum baccatum]
MAGACIVSNPDSDLESFSHNPAHGSFAPLAFQPSAITNCVNQRFLSYWVELLLRHSPTDSRRVWDWDPRAQPSKPILFPSLRIHFADFPCLHCSIDQRSAPTAALPELAPKVLQQPPRPPTHRGLALAPTAGVGRALKRHPFSRLVDSAAQETDFEQAYDALAPRLRWQAGQDVAARAGIQPDRTCRIQLTRRASKCSVDARPAPAPAPGKRCRALLPMRTLQGLKQVPLDTIARPVGGAEEMKARSAHARAPATTAAGARQRIGLGRMRAAPGARPEGSIQDLPLARRHRLIQSLAPAAPSWTTPPITDTSVQSRAADIATRAQTARTD